MLGARVKSLAAALGAACLLAVAAASPAAAQNIANPFGTLFNGASTTPITWSVGAGAGAVVVTCANVAIAGNPAPQGVGINAIGGPSTLMARFFPTFAGCSATIAGGGAVPATAVANCDWAYAVDSWNGVLGTSTERLQIGGGCPNPLNAVTLSIPAATCTIAVSQQPLIHNGTNIRITGQNTPWPGPSTGMKVVNSITTAIARTAFSCPGVVNPAPLMTMTSVFFLNGVWAGP
jgi:hypothetical protein